MKTVDRLTNVWVTLTLTDGTTTERIVMSADPLGLWVGATTFIPWTAVLRVEVAR